MSAAPAEEMSCFRVRWTHGAHGMKEEHQEAAVAEESLGEAARDTPDPRVVRLDVGVRVVRWGSAYPSKGWSPQYLMSSATSRTK